MHAKGLDQGMIDCLAPGHGHAVKVSPKFWAEHMGMPYHQARHPRTGDAQGPRHGDRALMALSSGSRSFTRYPVMPTFLP